MGQVIGSNPIPATRNSRQVNDLAAFLISGSFRKHGVSTQCQQMARRWGSASAGRITVPNLLRSAAQGTRFNAVWLSLAQEPASVPPVRIPLAPPPGKNDPVLGAAQRPKTRPFSCIPANRELPV